MEHRLNALEQEIESLRAALAALDDEQAAGRSRSRVPAPNCLFEPAVSSPSPSPPRPRPRAPRPPRPRPAHDGGALAGQARARAATAKSGAISPSAELERLLAETGGLTAVELARETGTDYGVVLGPHPPARAGRTGPPLGRATQPVATVHRLRVCETQQISECASRRSGAYKCDAAIGRAHVVTGR